MMKHCVLFLILDILFPTRLFETGNYNYKIGNHEWWQSSYQKRKGSRLILLYESGNDKAVALNDTLHAPNRGIRHQPSPTFPILLGGHQTAGYKYTFYHFVLM